MAYRSGTYIAFYAEGTSDPTESDMKYYNLLRAWDKNKRFDFTFVNSHDKVGAVRDSSKKTTLEKVLKERLRNSKNMILIIGNTTKNDRDWIPMEVQYAIDECKLPIIAAYPSYNYIMAPGKLSDLWPHSLKIRINNGNAKVIHIPFREKVIMCAISQFDYNNLPKTGLNWYSKEAYQSWGYIK